MLSENRAYLGKTKLFARQFSVWRPTNLYHTDGSDALKIHPSGKKSARRTQIYFALSPNDPPIDSPWQCK